MATITGTTGADAILTGFTDADGNVMPGEFDFRSVLVDAGAGNDTIDAWGGTTVEGGLGNDLIYSSFSEAQGDRGTIPLLHGEEGDDRFVSDGSVSLYGGPGADLAQMRVSDANEAVLADMGAGNDTIVMSGYNDFSAIHLRAGIGDDLVAIENLGGPDRYYYPGFTVSLGAGADTVAIGASQDAGQIALVDFDPNADSLVLSDGAPYAENGADLAAQIAQTQQWLHDNADQITEDDRFITVHYTGATGAVDVQIQGVAKIDLLGGYLPGEDGDLLRTDDDGVLLQGGAGADTLIGLGSDDTLLGGAGDDLIKMGDRSGAAEGGAGNDTLEAVMTKTADHVASTGDGADQVLVYGMGTNTKDAVLHITDYEAEVDSVTVMVDGTPVVLDLENLPDGFSASSDADGNLVVTMDADGGHDRIIFDGLGEVGDTGGTVHSADPLVYGTAGADLIYAEATGQVVNGLEGDDTLYALNGEDLLIGGRDDDYLYAGKRTTELQGGQGDDTLVANLTKGADHVLSGGSGHDNFDLWGEADDRFVSHVTITDFNAEQDSLSIAGHALSDGVDPDWALSSDADGNAVIGFNGNDSVTLQGMTAQQAADLWEGLAPEPDGIVQGTEGDDVIRDAYVDADGDSPQTAPDPVTVLGLGGDDTISLWTAYGDDTRVDGGAGADSLFVQMGHAAGGAGNDTLTGGGDGFDLSGGEGDDVLRYSGASGYIEPGEMTGGAGADTFDLSAQSLDVARYGTNHVSVTDYTLGEDQVAIGGATLTAEGLQAGMDDGSLSVSDAGGDTRITWQDPLPPGGDDGGYYGAAEMLLQGIDSADFLASLPSVPVPEDDPAMLEDEDLLDPMI